MTESEFGASGDAARQTWPEVEAALRDRAVSPRHALSEPDARRLLGSLGVPFQPFRVATSVEEAATAADAIGYPVVMKIVSPDIQHKAACGGVALGLSDSREVERAYAQMQSRVQSAAPRASLGGVLIEALVPAGQEYLVSAITDEQFGPVVSCGAGGALVEILDDVSLRLYPCDEASVRQMFAESRYVAATMGLRVQAQVAALVDVCGRLVQLDCVRAVELNPVRADKSGGILALDAVLELEPIVSGGHG